MKIQYFSDVHLEFGTLQAAAPDADIIVAAGDIGLGAAGVEWLKLSGKPTVYIAGNHEYYGGELDAVQGAIRAAANGSNVHFLECESVEFDGVRFLGATLWTDFMGGDPQLMEILRLQMNDYLQIRCGERHLEPGDLARINQLTRTWLREALAEPYVGRTVVVTHHAPLFASWHAQPDTPFKAAYCNDLSQILIDFPIDLWIHGHVHAPADYRTNELRVVCNPRGYHGYQLVDGFDSGRLITLA